jgi:predicted DNA-binding transcriptional regulator YafY
LVAALLLLQAHGRLTAAELADRLEVSLATARRDLEALSAAGIPVYPQPGRGGGWSLLGGARTDLTGLTSAEANALFALLGPATTAAAGGPGASAEARSAVRKLLGALPGPFRPDAEAVARAVLVDPAPWSAERSPRPPLVDRLQEAVVRRCKLRLRYADRTRERTDRLVDPWGLIDKDDVWYLIAGTEAGRRTFRVDRIIDAELTDTAAERLDGFELAEAWRQVVDEVERQRSSTSATVLVDARLTGVLRRQFGRHCRLAELRDDGKAAVSVAAPTALVIAQHLAGWGAGLDVVGRGAGDVAVRAELARIGAELLGRYRA